MLNLSCNAAEVSSAKLLCDPDDKRAVVIDFSRQSFTNIRWNALFQTGI